MKKTDEQMAEEYSNGVDNQAMHRFIRDCAKNDFLAGRASMRDEVKALVEALDGSTMVLKAVKLNSRDFTQQIVLSEHIQENLKAMKPFAKKGET